MLVTFLSDCAYTGDCRSIAAIAIDNIVLFFTIVLISCILNALAKLLNSFLSDLAYLAKMLNVLSLAPGMKENFTLFICPFDLTICLNPRLFTSELQKHAPPI